MIRIEGIPLLAGKILARIRSQKAVRIPRTGRGRRRLSSGRSATRFTAPVRPQVFASVLTSKEK
jgi:hypothetical protein